MVKEDARYPRSPRDVRRIRCLHWRANLRKGLKASVWVNPFQIGRDGTRNEVIAKYRAYLQTRPDLLGRLDELRGKRLACWCAPESCHGDVLAELAERKERGCCTTR